MALRWTSEHCGPGAIAYDADLLVGQVARYDITESGRTEVTGRYYIGFVRGDRVTGRCATLKEAQAGVEAAGANDIAARRAIAKPVRDGGARRSEGVETFSLRLEG